MEATAGRVVFTVVVLAIFIGAIVYTAICARAIVEREGAEAELEREVARVVDAAADRLCVETSNVESSTAGSVDAPRLNEPHTPLRRSLDAPLAPSVDVLTQG